ncbi:MAG: single-stranded-DNA-specific exonuclease RecJ [Spirochaetota bacterium]|nr:single-stranded-DNA-specific exonuclease RecJ [Spirochaetota bacterium]
MKSQWKVKSIDDQTVSGLSKVFLIDYNLASLLYVKGINNLVDAYHFIYPSLSNLFSPFLMKGMIDAVNRIRGAIINNERIGIFSDSDLDGLTSLTIMLNLLQRIGIQSCYRYPIEDEDYGLSIEAIDEFYEKGVELIITLDSGIRDVKEIEYAKQLNIDVIICDHHEPGNVTPDAIIVNPKQDGCNYPFKELAGVGVAFKLCHGILMSYLRSYNKLFVLITEDDNAINFTYIRNGIIEKNNTLEYDDFLNDINEVLRKDENIILYDNDNKEFFRNLCVNRNIYDIHRLMEDVLKNDNSPYKSDCDCLYFEVFNNNRDILNNLFAEVEHNHSSKILEFIDESIGLVSIGTIADIVPIVYENRTIVFHGIKSISSTQHPGLSLLLKRINKDVNSNSIAWEIAPLLNAPGRFGKGGLTAEFFLERDVNKLESILDEISILNDERKRIVSDIYNSILSDIEVGKIAVDKGLLFIQSEKIPEGLSGLLAGQLSEAVNMPVIVVSTAGNKRFVKGSGRTVGNFDFFSYVEPYSHMFEKIGGHAQAFGFLAREDTVKDIIEKIEIIIGNSFIGENEYAIDLEIPISRIDIDFIRNLSMFEPYGYKNEKPIFLTKGLVLKNFHRFGKNKNHGKFLFHDNHLVEAIGWNMADRMEKYSEREDIDIIYRLENNEYNNLISPRMIIVDMDHNQYTDSFD